jgi:hypothetical protein
LLGILSQTKLNPGHRSKQFNTPFSILPARAEQMFAQKNIWALPRRKEGRKEGSSFSGALLVYSDFV